MPLLFKVLAVALGFLLHMRHPLGQALQVRGNFLFAGIALLLMLVHGAQQRLQAAFEDVFKAVEVRGVLHAALQIVDVFAQLGVHVIGCGTAFSMARTRRLEIALKGLQALVELLEVSLELMLTAVRDGQHQHGKIVEDRQ